MPTEPAELIIDIYRFQIDERKLIIENTIDESEKISIIFSPFQASQLAHLLNSLIPENYGVRADFRIPVHDDIGLKGVIVDSKQKLECKVTSLSSSGLFIEIPIDQFRASLGAKCSMVLTYEDLEIEAPVIVTRKVRNGYGLAFSQQQDLESGANEKLNQLVMNVQRRWIAVNGNH